MSSSPAPPDAPPPAVAVTAGATPPAAPPPRRRARFARWLRAFRPQRMHINARERVRVCAGATLGVIFAAIASRALAPLGGGAWLIAPMGASAVLVFGAPASPLAQPWPVLGGNTLSALVGIACAAAIGEPALAGPLAVGLAIALMLALRCLHPPGGATALLAVLTHETAVHYAAFPVLVDSALVVAAGLVYNNLTGRRYPPHTVAPASPPAAGARAVPGSRFTAADLDAALAHYNQVLDVNIEDLEALLHEAEAAAYQRNFGSLRCRDIMFTDVVAVEYGTPLDEAWALLRERRVKALPVVDRVRRVIGIVSQADFLYHAGIDVRPGLVTRLRALVRRTEHTHTDKAEAVGQIMTREVRMAGAEQPVVDLVPMFWERGHHHIPIIDDERRLVGMITQSDLVRALYRAVMAPAGGAA